MSRRIVVVGYCASGKSTVAAELERRGYDVHVVAQEHSMVPDLWQRSDPDILIYLDAGLGEIRSRRDDPNWPEWLYDLQRMRLRDAWDHADLLVNTSDQDVGGVVRSILERISPLDDT